MDKLEASLAAYQDAEAARGTPEGERAYLAARGAHIVAMNEAAEAYRAKAAEEDQKSLEEA